MGSVFIKKIFKPLNSRTLLMKTLGVLLGLFRIVTFR